jgi:CRP/FNR family transcriptional regulator
MDAPSLPALPIPEASWESGGLANTSNLVAVIDIVLDAYSKSIIEAHLLKEPNYLQHRFEETNNELAQAQERILTLSQRSPVEKVTSFIRRIRRWQSEGRQVHVPITRHDIADYLGFTTETVSRTFMQLCDQQVVRSINQHDIEILDVEKLKRLSEA